MNVTRIGRKSTDAVSLVNPIDPDELVGRFRADSPFFAWQIADFVPIGSPPFVVGRPQQCGIGCELDRVVATVDRPTTRTRDVELMFGQRRTGCEARYGMWRHVLPRRARAIVLKWTPNLFASTRAENGDIRICSTSSAVNKCRQ